MENNDISSKYIQSFKKKQQTNRRKTWAILLLLILISATLSFWLVDYMYPIAIDNYGFRINYYLLILGILWQIAVLIKNKNKNTAFMLAAIPPSRRKPLFGKNLTHIRQHHPRPFLPFIHPIVMGHIITWISTIPGALIAAALLPGDVRRWKTILKEYGGLSLALGSSIYLLFTYMSFNYNYTLLTVNIINSLLIGLSIPGLSAIFYYIGSITAPTKGTPERTAIGGLILFAFWIFILLVFKWPLIERFIFSIIFKLAEGFWILLIIFDISQQYSLHK
ncbi:MAG: hypothetical protein GXO59_06680 [Dictyoglomi bacterium]|nr:hypothetical protein [Dictyoglomota bacterium]